jgi:hypothetical protein
VERLEGKLPVSIKLGSKCYLETHTKNSKIQMTFLFWMFPVVNLVIFSNINMVNLKLKRVCTIPLTLHQRKLKYLSELATSTLV